MKYFLLFLPFIFSNPEYGVEYNLERVKRGIPIMEENSTIQRKNNSSGYVLISYSVVKKFIGSSSCHGIKIVIVEHDLIKQERDYYFKVCTEGNEELVLEYDYQSSSWTVALHQTNSTRNVLKHPDKNNSLIQADSVLASWGLSRMGK